MNWDKFTEVMIKFWSELVRVVTPVILGFWLLIQPIKDSLTFIIFLTIFDMILGITAARKQKHRITSKSMSRTVSKLFVYLTSIIMVYFCHKYLAIPEVAYNWVLALIGLIETKSVFENLYRLTGVDVLKTLINAIQSLKQEKEKQFEPVKDTSDEANKNN